MNSAERHDNESDMDGIGKVLANARKAAIQYYRLTGKPLGITGEIGEFEAARRLGLKLVEARTPGYDAVDGSGRRYRITSRSFSKSGRKKSQRIAHQCNQV